MFPSDVGERTVGTKNTDKTIPSRLCTYLVFILLRKVLFYMVMLLFNGQSEIQFMLSYAHGRYIFIMSTLNWSTKFSGLITLVVFVFVNMHSSVIIGVPKNMHLRDNNKV
jgi:hypothetical protein